MGRVQLCFSLGRFTSTGGAANRRKNQTTAKSKKNNQK
jgi:hypothetical protein